eukprot:Rmarinus@m.25561
MWWWWVGVFLWLGRLAATSDDCSRGCSDNAVCIEGTGCLCNSGYYGNGTLCTSCGDNMVSATGSSSQQDCFCVEGFEKRDNGVCEELCTTSEAIEFSISSMDVGIWSSGGCDFADLGGTRSCCEVAAAMFAHDCLSKLVSLAPHAVPSHPYYSTLAAMEEKCGILPGIGFAYEEACGDGVREGWERCDDGNHVDGDGCSSCWIDDGYSCGSLANSTLSVCRICAEDCLTRHRELCQIPGGPCMACEEGYTEVDGECAQIMEVWYTVVNHTGPWDSANPGPSGGHCEYIDLGLLLEPDLRLPTAERYLAFVRSAKAAGSIPDGGGGNCSLQAAVSQSPRGSSIVAMIEIAPDEVVGYDLKIGFQKPGNVVVFSDRGEETTVPVVNGRHQRIFDLHSSSLVIISGLILNKAAAAEGAIVRNYGGRAVIENVLVENAEVPYIPANRTDPEYNCAGTLLESAGAVALRGVVFRQNYLRDYSRPDLCFTEIGHTLMMYGSTEMSDVLFEDNNVAGPLLSMYGHSSKSHILGLVMQRNVVRGESLFLIETEVELANFTARANSGERGGVVSIRGRQTVIIDGFSIEENVVADLEGIVYNLGNLTLLDGQVQGNFVADDSSVLYNRGTLLMDSVSFRGNEGAVLDTATDATLFYCIFEENKGTSKYHTINNSGKLVISNCFFDDPNLPAEIVNIKTSSSFVLRDSVLPWSETMHVAHCSEKLSWHYYPARQACGIHAECTFQANKGVTCECPLESYGDPTEMCVGLTTLRLLPTNNVAMYVTKGERDDGYRSTTEVRFVADGFGSLGWAVNLDMLPPWLSIVPSAGTFLTGGLCPDEPIDVTVMVDLEHVSGEYRSQIVSVNITTFSNATGSFVSAPDVQSLLVATDTTLTVALEAEIIPSAVTSVLEASTRCLNSQIYPSAPCEVPAGSLVFLSVYLRDSANYSLGVGGDTYTFESDPLVEIRSEATFDNGTSVIGFVAPQTHFSVRVTLRGVDVQGSPAYFHVECSGDDTWSNSAMQCESPGVPIPKLLIVVGLGSGFVVTAISLQLLKAKKGSKAKILEMDMADRETLSVLLSCFTDVLDVGTDIGAYYALQNDDDLHEFEAWYLSAVSIAVVATLVSLCVKLHGLRQCLLEFRAYSQRKIRGPDQVFVRPITISTVPGICKLVCDADVAMVLHMIYRQLTFHLVAVVSLIVEDIPMLVLNTLILLSSKTSTAVVLSMEVTCFLSGIRLSKVVVASRTMRRAVRLRERAALASTATVSNQEKASLTSIALASTSTMSSRENSAGTAPNRGRTAHALAAPISSREKASLVSAPNSRRGKANSSSTSAACQKTSSTAVNSTYHSPAPHFQHSWFSP